MSIEVLYLPKNFYTPKQSSGYAPAKYPTSGIQLDPEFFWIKFYHLHRYGHQQRP